MNEYELYHFGVKGMKWGIRKARPQIGASRPFGRQSGYGSRPTSNKTSTRSSSASRSANNRPNDDQQRQAKIAKAKKAVKVGAAVAGTILAAYGAKKFHDFVRDTNRSYRIDQITRDVENMISDRSVSGNPFSADKKGQMIRSGWTAGRNIAKNDSFGSALKNTTKYALERRTRRR